MLCQKSSGQLEFGKVEMTYIDESPEWETQIYELRTVDPILGGTDGISNRQATQLGNRTQWLKEQMIRHNTAENPHPQYSEETANLAFDLNLKFADLKDELLALRSNTGELWNSLPSPAGTRIVFAQSSAPLGWTKLTEHNDRALRVVSGEAGIGGVHAFSSAFASKGISGEVHNATLAEWQMPYHTHTVLVKQYYDASGSKYSAWIGEKNSLAGYTGGSGAHNHGITIDPLDMRVQYVDVIIASRDWYGES